MSFPLPDYLAPLSMEDPAYAALNETVYKFLLKPPGLGGFKEAEIVKFTQAHFVYRVYGGEGKASQCGYWWNLDAPQNTTQSYFEQFAVCEEWNDATNMVRCSVPVNFTAVVGTGQSATCENNVTLVPEDSVLQLNGNICEVANIDGPSLTCEWCAADEFSLQDSACVEMLLLDETSTAKNSCFDSMLAAGFALGLTGLNGLF